MKTVKLLLMLTFVVPAFAMDLEQSREEAMRRADIALFSAIENCHRNDGKHASRMDAIRDSSYNLSATEFNNILLQHGQAIANKSNLDAYFHACNDCTEVENFIVVGVCYLSKAIEAGKGDMSVMDIAKECKKRNEK